MSQVIRTTVSLVFRPPDAASKVPLEHFREATQMVMSDYIFQRLAGCQVLALEVRAEYVQE